MQLNGHDYGNRPGQALNTTGIQQTEEDLSAAGRGSQPGSPYDKVGFVVY